MMTTPASAMREEVWELIEDQIEVFGKPACLTSSELMEYHYRAERIEELGQELDRIASTTVLEKLFGKAASGFSHS